MRNAYIGIGANLGERLVNLKKALNMLSSEKEISVQAVSAIYETAPVGGPEQGPFLNACAALQTTLTPTLLLLKMLEVENSLGRVREVRWGPRVIDLDLLVYEGVIMNTPLLELPHPRMIERNFVLIPLADIDRELLIPGHGKTVGEILSDRDATDDLEVFMPPSWFTIK